MCANVCVCVCVCVRAQTLEITVLGKYSLETIYIKNLQGVYHQIKSHRRP